MTQQLPPGFELDEPVEELPQGFMLNEMPAGFQLDRPKTETEIEAEKEMRRMESQEPQKGMFKKIGEAYRGSEDERTKHIPELIEPNGVFAGHDPSVLASVAWMATTATPEEVARSIEKMELPDIAIQWAVTTDGEPYPIVTNRQTGAQAIINRPGASKMDASSLGAGMAMFTPAGRAKTIIGALGSNAATQAAIEGGQVLAGGEFNPDEVVLAGGLGAAPKMAENLIGTAGRYAANKAPAPEQQAILDAAAEQDIPIQTSDVLPPKTFMGKVAQFSGEAVPVFGTGVQRAEQQAAREEALQKLAESSRADYEEIYQGLMNQNKKASAAAVKLMDRASRQVANNPIKGSNAIDFITEEIDRIKYLKSGELKEGYDKAKVAFLENTAYNILKDETFSGIRNLRTNLRKDYGVAVGDLSLIDKPLADKIYKAMTRDLDETIRQDLGEQGFKQWKKGNTIYAKEFDKMDKSKIKKLFNQGDDISRHDVEKIMFSTDDKTRRLLYRSLDSRGRENVRNAIITNMIKKSSETGELSVNQFTGMARRKANVINDFFKGVKKKEFDGLMKALQATEGAQAAGQFNRQTGQTALPALGVGSAMTNLAKTIMSAGTVGYGARVYESPEVRNILLRINATPKGHHNFEKYLRELSVALNSAVQSSLQAEDVTGE
jgi:hypothetical protein